jgi:hypothetical protein
MTTQMFRAATTAALLAAALALPLASQAATTTAAPPQTYTLQTHLTQQYHAGEYAGTMNLTVYPNGIVQGNYRPSDGGTRIVTGGITGTNIWLDIGLDHSLHLSGTFKNGVLQAVADIPSEDPYTMNAAVAPNQH